MATTKRSPAMGVPQGEFDALVPLNGFVLIQRENQPAAVGRILLPGKSADEYRKEYCWATVVRLGKPDYDHSRGTFKPTQLSVGDRVFIDRYAGHDLEVMETGHRFVLVGEQECFLQVVAAA